MKSVLVRVRPLLTGYATTLALRAMLDTLRSSGKRVVAYLPDGGGNREALVASGAETILLAPQSSLDLVGLLAEASFFAEVLERVGVGAQVEAVGEYKSAADSLRRTSMSPQHREQVDAVLDATYAALVERIAAGRGRTPEQVRAWIDGGPYRAEDAVRAGLIDGVAYEDELGPLVSPGAKRPRTLRWESYRRRKLPRAAFALRRRPAIALVDVRGILVDRGPALLRLARSELIIPTLRAARADRSVCAVVLCIDSRGGSGLASDRIWREVVRLREKKPVIAWMADVAASGGYYVAAAADRIVAQPLAVTGSIGVLAAKLTLGGMLERIGIRREALKRGKRAGMISSIAPLSDDERAVLRGQVEGFYRDFVQRVAEGRKREGSEIELSARGRVFVAEEAQRRGLVDDLGSIDRAIEIARERAAGRGARARVVSYGMTRPRPIPPPEPLAPAESATRVLGELHALVGAGAVLAILPFDLRIR